MTLSATKQSTSAGGDIRHAAQVIQAGGVVAYPTEAVFGLGCDPDNETAVVRLLEMKQRPRAKGLILIAASFSQLSAYCANLPADRQHIVQASWPGPHTWLFPVSDACPTWLCGDHASIAVRVTAHPPAAELCRTCQSALISTSANLAGQDPARNVAEVKSAFPKGIDYLLQGELGDQARPTSIRDALTGQVIRP